MERKLFYIHSNHIHIFFCDSSYTSIILYRWGNKKLAFRAQVGKSNNKYSRQLLLHFLFMQSSATHVHWYVVCVCVLLSLDARVHHHLWCMFVCWLNNINATVIIHRWWHDRKLYKVCMNAFVKKLIQENEVEVLQAKKVLLN